MDEEYLEKGPTVVIMAIHKQNNEGRAAETLIT